MMIRRWLTLLMFITLSLSSHAQTYTSPNLNSNNSSTGPFGAWIGLNQFSVGAILGPTTFAGLSSGLLSGAANGTSVVLTDGTPGSPCSGGGSGALAIRLSGAWSCISLSAGVIITLDTNSSNNSSQSLLNFTNTTGAGGITASNPSGGLEEFSVANIQGSDGKLLSAGTISGTSITLCTDSNGGATTSGCPSYSFVALDTNGSPNSSQSLLNFTNTTGAGGINFSNPSGGLEEATIANIQGTDSNLLSSGTITSGSGHTLCTDANSGATTSGCSSGGGVSGSGTAATLPIWTGSTALGNSLLSQASGSGGTYLDLNLAGINLNNRNTGSGQFDFNCPGANNCGAVYIQSYASSGNPNSTLTVDNSQGQVEITTGDSSGNGGAWIFQPGLNKQLQFPGTTFTNLQSPPSVGWIVYCTNCAEGSNPCSTSGGTGSGTWAFSMEVNGGGSTKWKCF